MCVIHTYIHRAVVRADPAVPEMVTGVKQGSCCLRRGGGAHAVRPGSHGLDARLCLRKLAWPLGSRVTLEESEDVSQAANAQTIRGPRHLS